MIICPCNVFSDGEVRALMATRSPGSGAAQVYRGLGHEPQCGRCARTIHGIMRECGTLAAINAEQGRQSR